MKSVLLMVHDDAGQEARLQTALDLTRALCGHLTCVDVFVPRVFADDALTMGAGASWIVAEEVDAERAFGAQVRSRVAGEGVAWDWVEAAGEIGRCIADHAGLADVIVCSRGGDRLLGSELPGAAADIAMANRQPVVAVPNGGKAVNWSGRALVAWDGSSPAMAALRGAAPILRLAAEAEILEVDDRLAGPPAEAAARYLSRHGVPSTVRRIHSLHRPTADLIEAHAQALDADYIVMGAFGHSRVRELVFGGVTRAMIRNSAYPLVLAH